MTEVLVSGSFDDLRLRHIRLLEEAAKLGQVRVLLWDDAAVEAQTGRTPRFPLAERLYMTQALRFVNSVEVTSLPAGGDALAPTAQRPSDLWVVDAEADSPARSAFRRAAGMGYRVVQPAELESVPPPSAELMLNPGRRRSVVTGCYDWLHSGHVRFFEEVAQFGDLYVVVGNDAAVRGLKGEGHPFFPAALRCYMTGAVRHVTQALVSSGTGWLDAEQEIKQIRPHFLAVNEDGDKPEKRAFCEANGIEYVVLARTPKEGLPRRASTELRGY